MNPIDQFDFFASGPLLPESFGVEEGNDSAPSGPSSAAITPHNFESLQDQPSTSTAQFPIRQEHQHGFYFEAQNQPSTSAGPMMHHQPTQPGSRFENQHQRQQQAQQHQLQAHPRFYGHPQQLSQMPQGPLMHPQMSLDGAPMAKRARTGLHPMQNGAEMARYNQFSQPMRPMPLPHQQRHDFPQGQHQDPKRARQEEHRMNEMMEQQKRQMWRQDHQMYGMDQPGPSNAVPNHYPHLHQQQNGMGMQFDLTKIKQEPIEEETDQKCPQCAYNIGRVVESQRALQEQQLEFQKALNAERTKLNQSNRSKDQEIAELRRILENNGIAVPIRTPNSIPNTATTSSSPPEVTTISDDQPMLSRDMAPYAQREQLPPDGFRNPLEAEAYLALSFEQMEWSNWPEVQKFLFKPRMVGEGNEGIALAQPVPLVTKPHNIFMSNKKERGESKHWSELKQVDKEFWVRIQQELVARQRREMDLGLTVEKPKEAPRATKRNRVSDAHHQPAPVQFPIPQYPNSQHFVRPPFVPQPNMQYPNPQQHPYPQQFNNQYPYGPH